MSQTYQTMAVDEKPEPMSLAEPINTGKMFYDVKISKVTNGFIVKVGCQTFVEKTWDAIAAALSEYWKDPSAAQKKFCNTND